MKITFLGAGYVGLTSATHFAGTHNVIVYDPDNEKIQKAERVKRGATELHVHEPGLLELIQKNADNLVFTTDLVKALSDPDIIFISVGTPPNEKGRANLSYIKSAAKQIGKTIRKECVVLVKSTVPPGTSHLVSSIIKEQTNINIPVGSCPEFLAEGRAMEDLRTPSRIVFGLDERDAREKISNFFLTMHHRDKIVSTTVVNSELIKYASNAMLATRISFVNSLAMLCDEIGADITEVAKAMGQDPRIGSKFLYAGFGYGGSCFPKDTSAIAEYASLLGSPLPIVDATIQINKQVLANFENKIVCAYETLEGKQFALWGVGFKAGTDDIRDSRAAILAKSLISKGATIHLFDPIRAAAENLTKELTQEEKAFCKVYDKQYGMFKTPIDGLIIGNEDMKFRNPDLNILFRTKIFDGKNVLAKNLIQEAKKKGFEYQGVGVSLEKKDITTFLKEY